MRQVPLYQHDYGFPLHILIKAHIQCAQACLDCETAGIPWSKWEPPIKRDAVREYDAHLYLEMA